MPWFVMYLCVPWFHFLNPKESAYEYNLISFRQWTIYLYGMCIADCKVSLTTSTMGNFGLQLTMPAIRNDHINVQIVTFVQSLTDCAANNSTISRGGAGGKAVAWGYN